MVFAVFSFTGFAQYFPLPPSVRPERENDLLSQLKHSKPDTNRVRLLLDLANLYSCKPLRITSNYDRALYYARQASEWSGRLQDQKGYADAQVFIAYVFTLKYDLPSAERLLGTVQDMARINMLLILAATINESDGESHQYDSSAKYLAEALELTRKLNQPEKRIMTLANMAGANDDLNKVSLADKQINEAIRESGKIGFPFVQYAYKELSWVKMEAGEYDSALFCELAAIKSAIATKDSFYLGDLYSDLGFIYNHVGKQEEAIGCAKKAIECYSTYPGRYSIFEPVNIVNDALTRLHRNRETFAFITDFFARHKPQNFPDSSLSRSILTRFYISEKRYDLAVKMRLQQLQLAKQHNQLSAGRYWDVGDAYIQDHQYAKAKPYLLAALHFPTVNMTVRMQSITQYYLFLCDSAAGDYISAIRHLDQNKILDDSDSRASRTNEVQRLQIQFETAKKESDLKFKDQNIQLLTQMNKVQLANLREANHVKDITIAAIVFLLAGGGLLYRQYRQKQRANRVVTEKNETISRKNEILQHLVAEKEWLLKEVHHRVKNNLHTVICLLESQAYYLENDALKAIENTQHRIYAMSLIHQRVYQSEDVRTIDMATYLPDFIHYLQDSFGGLPHIRFLLDIENLTLGVGQAIPLALIVNEAVTNSIKYAFPGNRHGEIAIELHATERQVRLFVSDNGIGINAAIEKAELNSLGIQLMKGLTREIYGTLSFDMTKGVRIAVVFDQNMLDDPEEAESSLRQFMPEKGSR